MSNPTETETEQIFVLSNKNSQYFSETFLHELKKNITCVRELEIKRKVFPGFPNGEKYVHIDVGKKPLALFGRDCVVVSSIHSDDDLLEFFRVAYTLANLGSRSRIFIIPYLEQKDENNNPDGYISQIKPNAQLFSALTTYGLGNSFLFMDMHIPGFLHYLEGSSLHVELPGCKFLDIHTKREKPDFFADDYMFVAADLGRPKVVAEFAKNHGKELAFIHRFEKRSSASLSTNAYGEVIGEVRDKHTIVYDDLIRTGTTLVQGAELLISKGAKSVKAIVSHFCGGKEIIQKLLDSPIQHIILSNSTIWSQDPLIASHPDRFTVFDVAPLFADAVMNIVRPNILNLPISPTPSSLVPNSTGHIPYLAVTGGYGAGTLSSSFPSSSTSPLLNIQGPTTTTSNE